MSASESAPKQDDDRGRGAESPLEIPFRGWRDILLRVWEKMGSNHLSIAAAGIAYFALLAVFPGLAALVSLYGLISDPVAVQQQLESVQPIIPADAYSIMKTQLETLTSQTESNLNFGFLGGLLLTLVSANRGVVNLIEAMNIVYEEHETRGLIKKNLLSLFYTLVIVVAIALTLMLIVLAPAFLAFFPVPEMVQAGFAYLQWPVLAVMSIILLDFIYRFFPNRERATWRWVTWGSLFAAVVWILASVLFSFYVSNFGNYNKMYGSVGAVIVLMIWFYITGYIVLLGGQLNAEVEHQTALDSTTGKPRPRGERGAYVADHLGEEK